MGRLTQGATLILAWVACLLALAAEGCMKDSANTPLQPNADPAQVQPLAKKGLPGAVQVTLVADMSGFSANRIDANLQNAWGVAMAPHGIFWISANHSGLAVVYDKDGNSVREPVAIPTPTTSTGGAPSGAVFNSSGAFIIPGTGAPAKVIFASEDGILVAWNSGTNAVKVADRSGTNAVYKGIAIISSRKSRVLLVTNFRGAKVEIFDESFHFVTDTLFKDPDIPTGFAPFNIRELDGKVFVTYAKQKPPDNMDDEKGPGFGFVNVFNHEGRLERRFASQGDLNSPWGLTETDGGKGLPPHTILVGNFGDGRINAFDAHGKSLGPLSDQNGNPITIDGLWAITSVHGVSAPPKNSGVMYFTAGPNDENDGLFGFLSIEQGKGGKH